MLRFVGSTSAVAVEILLANGDRVHVAKVNLNEYSLHDTIGHQNRQPRQSYLLKFYFKYLSDSF